VSVHRNDCCDVGLRTYFARESPASPPPLPYNCLARSPPCYANAQHVEYASADAAPQAVRSWMMLIADIAVAP